jgi:hypothetical protein
VQKKTGKLVQEIQTRRSKKTRKGDRQWGVKRQTKGWKETGKREGV